MARKGGTKLLSKTRLTRRFASEYLPYGERFFARHGGKAVFFVRFIAVLRATAAWTAGLARMGWCQFFAWDTTGAIVWATTVGLVAYYLGDAAADVIRRYGLLAAAGLIVFSALIYLIVRRVEQRAMKEGGLSR
jgi:membrane protein DedA with SNARE-associated domain